MGNPENDQGEILVAATRVRLRSLWYFPAFVWRAAQAGKQARTAPGNLHSDQFRDAKGAFWTLTMWQDESAMRAFMMSGAHAKIMPRAPEWFSESAVVHWRQAGTAVPSRAEMHRRLQNEGRPTRVKFPNEAHKAFKIAPPG